MIIGTGLIASAFASHSFTKDPNIIIFASGVSNSHETSAAEFSRERDLLLKALEHDKLIFYFSTCSIADPELRMSPYVVHKIAMESLVSSSGKYAIFRLPQVVGKTSNPNTLTNYLYRHIKSGTPFQLWSRASRNIIDVDDVASIISHLQRSRKAHNVTVNIACPFSTPVSALVATFELILKTRGNYTVMAAGGSYPIDVAVAAQAARELGIVFDDMYIEKLLRKYYSE